MDTVNPFNDRNPLTVKLYGRSRGKFVAGICHAFALIEYKLSLPANTRDAPWRVPNKHQDYFAWRKAMVLERNEIELTLVDLFNGAPLAVGKFDWPMVDGWANYDLELAQALARDYARVCVKALGLGKADDDPQG